MRWFENFRQHKYRGQRISTKTYYIFEHFVWPYVIAYPKDRPVGPRDFRVAENSWLYMVLDGEWGEVGMDGIRGKEEWL